LCRTLYCIGILGQGAGIGQWYSAGLWVGWSGVGIFLPTTAYRTALGPIQPPIQWVSGALPWGKAAGAWSWPLISI